MRRHIRRRKALQLARLRQTWSHVFVQVREYIAAQRGLARHMKRQAEIDARGRVIFVHDDEAWLRALAERQEIRHTPLLSGEIGQIDRFRIYETPAR